MIQDGDGPIVVGVDGSAQCREALRWALDEARMRGRRVDAVTAWEPFAGTWASPMGAVPVDAFTARTIERDVRADLEATVTEVAAQFPEVEVRCLTGAGSPSSVLISAAERENASMIVVGSRGRGGFNRLLLGSVSEQCATHAPCPVMVIR